MRRSDKAALLLCLLAVLASWWVARRYFENLAHLEDEMAYVWQAQVLARGEISLPSPEYPNSFLWPFVVDHQGQRFGKYPLGWPAVLALGELLHLRELVNPLLAGLAVWLIYRLGRRLFGEPVALLAAFLTVVSPFFLVNSGSLLSHPLGLVLSAAFALAWLQAFTSPPPAGQSSRRLWAVTIAAALLLAALVLTRPFTALAVAVPFAFHGLYRLVTGDGQVRRRLFTFVLLAGSLSLLHLAWQYTVTGDPLLNPYTLWWPYDKIGFGPGVGRLSQGHSLHQAWINTKFSLRVGYWDLFGWPRVSWLFLPVGLLVLWFKSARRLEGLLLVGVLVSLVVAYLAYWVGASLYGPRYYYEGLTGAVLLTALGVAYLAGWPVRPAEIWAPPAGWRRVRAPAVAALLALLVGFNLLFYLPARLEVMSGLYGVSRAHQQPFLTPTAQQLTPALVIVHPQKAWIEYGTLLELQSPFMDSPFVFVYARGAEQDRAVAALFPERTILHYYPDEPDRFYPAPRQ